MAIARPLFIFLMASPGRFMFQRSQRGKAFDGIGDAAPCKMLGAQDGYQLNEFASLFKTREKVRLLVFLVIILDEVPNDLGRFCQKLRVENVFLCKPPGDFFIDEQDAVENAVLAH